MEGAGRAEIRLLILAEGYLGLMTSKTANCVIRYQPETVCAVVDSRFAGKMVADVLGFGEGIPIVGGIEEGIEHEPNTLLIGIAPAGGSLPPRWDQFLRLILEAGLDIVSGLHSYLGDNEVYRALASQTGSIIWDLRRPPNDLEIPPHDWQQRRATVILTVGTDCNSGKMTAAMELTQAAQEHGYPAAMAATGQTGIYLTGRGIAVDAVASDFIAGAAHQLVTEASEGVDLVFVEGQGSLFHPAYSGVTLGLLHGVAPDFLVLCHTPSRPTVEEYPQIQIPPLPKAISIYEETAAVCRSAPTIGIALNCCELSAEEARSIVLDTAAETGLPTTDLIRFGAEPLLNALLEAL